MKYALVNQAEGKIENIIEYDGVSRFDLKPGYVLVQAADYLEIGDDPLKPEPAAKPEASDQEKDEALVSDLKFDRGLFAAWQIEIKASPDLSFKDFVKDLNVKFLAFLESEK